MKKYALTMLFLVSFLIYLPIAAVDLESAKGVDTEFLLNNQESPLFFLEGITTNYKGEVPDYEILVSETISNDVYSFDIPLLEFSSEILGDNIITMNVDFVVFDYKLSDVTGGADLFCYIQQNIT